MKYKIHDQDYTKEVNSLVDFAQNRMGFSNKPKVLFSDDPQNAAKTLGKTGYYDPNTTEIRIFMTGRHVKDILRSLAHELVHHMQNEQGSLRHDGYMGPGYAQKNPKMREMERQAYEMGNLCFRDWEDSLKEKHPTIYNERRNHKMSLNDWKNKELNQLLMERWGFGKKSQPEGTELQELDLKKLPRDMPDGGVYGPEGGLYGVGEKGKTKDGHPGSTSLNISRDKKVRDRYNKGVVDVENPELEEMASKDWYTDRDETFADMKYRYAREMEKDPHEPKPVLGITPGQDLPPGHPDAGISGVGEKGAMPHGSPNPENRWGHNLHGGEVDPEDPELEEGFGAGPMDPMGGMSSEEGAPPMSAQEMAKADCMDAKVQQGMSGCEAEAACQEEMGQMDPVEPVGKTPMPAGMPFQENRRRQGKSLRRKVKVRLKK